MSNLKVSTRIAVIAKITKIEPGEAGAIKPPPNNEL